ncbi:unnamed protein product [Soboliphyme baturini]|uniref:glucose-6-phosphatase n=1 Tax=Soboliphyme baturini TaxID=241478 RepID=A0A183INV3_9BILA|nr:unnamed protein product [Soboliphyme baturini]
MLDVIACSQQPLFGRNPVCSGGRQLLLQRGSSENSRMSTEDAETKSVSCHAYMRAMPSDMCTSLTVQLSHECRCNSKKHISIDDAVMSLMDIIQKNGVYFELWLQKVLKGQAEHIFNITKVGDPDVLIFYLFPFISAVHRILFLRFVLVTALCDIINNIMKWMLHGERPYWWIYESGTYVVPPSLKQFPLSCETGPGSPSGHTMITTAVWYIVVWAYIKYVIGKSRQRFLLSTCAWCLYGLLFVLVAVSRLYIGAHFPHQVLLGGIIGFFFGWLFTRLQVGMLRMKHCLLTVLGLVILAVIVYNGMILCGVDPEWSVKLALKHCVDPSWVHLTTTPLNALFRDCGAIIGVGFAVESKYFIETSGVLHRDGSEVITSVVSLLLVQLCSHIPRPVHNLTLYYLGTFAQYCCITFVSVALVPYVVKTIWNLKQFPKSVGSMGPGLFRSMARRKVTANF